MKSEMRKFLFEKARGSEDRKKERTGHGDLNSKFTR